MVKALNEKLSSLERVSFKFTGWVGTPYSVIAHTAFFIGIFILTLFGVTTDRILLILTTAVSLEAIYLSIFIQMTINRNTESLEEIEEDIEDIQEDVNEEEEAHKIVRDIGKEIKRIEQDLNTLKTKGIL